MQFLLIRQSKPVRCVSLSQGGCSEVWRSSDCLPISSLTFHPLDHLLVIAVGHRLYFWDWTESQPFTERETCQRDQRVRYCIATHLFSTLVYAVTVVCSYQLRHLTDSVINAIYNAGG